MLGESKGNTQVTAKGWRPARQLGKKRSSLEQHSTIPPVLVPLNSGPWPTGSPRIPVGSGSQRTNENPTSGLATTSFLPANISQVHWIHCIICAFNICQFHNIVSERQREKKKNCPQKLAFAYILLMLYIIGDLFLISIRLYTQAMHVYYVDDNEFSKV